MADGNMLKLLSFPLTVNDHTTRIHPGLSRIAPPILTFQQIALVKALRHFYCQLGTCNQLHLLDLSSTIIQ